MEYLHFLQSPQLFVEITDKPTNATLKKKQHIIKNTAVVNKNCNRPLRKKTVGEGLGGDWPINGNLMTVEYRLLVKLNPCSAMAVIGSRHVASHVVGYGCWVC